MTPTEKNVFEGIFDEISQGHLPRPRRRGEQEGKGASASSSSMVDRARDKKIGDETLQRYPHTLRAAAQVALEKFELTPERPILSGMIGLEEEQAKKMAEWKHYHDIQTKEKERVSALMAQCQSDIELWHVMEAEVFSLPQKLGILEVPKRGKRVRKVTKVGIMEDKMEKPPKANRASKTEKEEPRLGVRKRAEPAPTSEARTMDVHGPLYPYYLATGINLFGTAFSRPSPLAFNILPRVKSLGLPSYVLGVSTSLFNNLAQLHWRQFGDMVSTVEVLQEMRAVGLWANQETLDLLVSVSQDVHACSWGAQGQLAMAITSMPPFNGSLSGKLQNLRDYAVGSIKEHGEKPAWEEAIGYDEYDYGGRGDQDDRRPKHRYTRYGNEGHRSYGNEDQRNYGSLGQRGYGNGSQRSSARLSNYRG